MLTARNQPVAAAILAGGLARRMGGANKAALEIGGLSILRRQLAVLRQVADPVFIVSSRAEPFEALQLRVVPDAIEQAGPLGGIYTAITASPADRTIVVACDLPYLTAPLLRLLTVETTADVVMPRSARGYEPLCASWTAACAPIIKRRIADGKLSAGLVVEELRVEEIGPGVLASCDPHGLLFVNVNTPHDYERAQALSRLESNRSQDRIMESEPS